jgi:hypothetical protein
MPLRRLALGLLHSPRAFDSLGRRRYHQAPSFDEIGFGSSRLIHKSMREPLTQSSGPRVVQDIPFRKWTPWKVKSMKRVSTLQSFKYVNETLGRDCDQGVIIRFRNNEAADAHDIKQKLQKDFDQDASTLQTVEFWIGEVRRSMSIVQIAMMKIAEEDLVLMTLM